MSELGIPLTKEPIFHQYDVYGNLFGLMEAHPLTPMVSEFLTSYGTLAGEHEIMPTIHKELERRTLLYSLLMPVMNQYMEGHITKMLVQLYA
jgi:hypothetical protein